MEKWYWKEHQHRFDIPHRSTFLPMLCSRPSIKSVAKPTSGSFSDEAEPLSPKVGCMGQVKKRNGRVIGFPTPYKFTGHSNVGAIKANACNSIVISCSNAKYSKLRKLFSSKSLAGPTVSSPSTAAATTTTTSTAARTRRRSVSKRGSFSSEKGNLKEAVNIREMDPPLPVVKKVRKPEDEEGGSLWRRRFGGVAPHLRSLEIQHNNPRHQLQLVTV
ncbi:uncharacterized protein LOC116203478 [Punica granatum]|uniref:Uncharacterized protein n=2 Tax=Punica granatum TaxID=22663 RepID=A0A2I0KZD5_PUNGR|nr:uncharacterized protein LOC116203478 [Punica granatum]PKI73835.1 hypothetical protein CRG98_005705 [Punica granatum]